MTPMHRPLIAAVAALVTAAPVAVHGEPCSLQIDGARGGLRTAPDTLVAGDRSLLLQVAAGEHRLDFAPFGGGKAASLPLDLPDGGSVHVAVGRLAARMPDAEAPWSVGIAAPLRLDAFVARDGDGFGGAVPAGWHATGELIAVEPPRSPGTTGPSLFIADEPPHDYVVHARVRSSSGDEVGLIARANAPDQHYRLVWLPAQQRVRLLRQMGDQLLVLAEAPGPAADGRVHDLALQVSGFRLQAFCDDAAVAQVLDGAHGSGRFGLWVSSGTVAEFSQVAAEVPWAALAVVAAMVTPGRADIVGRAPASAGSGYCLALRLDQPFGPILGGDGSEPFLGVGPAAPVFFVGREAGTSVTGMRGMIGPRGEFAAHLEWPRTAVLRGRVALAGGYVIDVDGSAVQSLLPAARVIF
jgi:hypothetical protein